MEDAGKDWERFPVNTSVTFTCVLARSSCWKPSTSLLSSAALSWTNEEEENSRQTGSAATKTDMFLLFAVKMIEVN